MKTWLIHSRNLQLNWKILHFFHVAQHPVRYHPLFFFNSPSFAFHDYSIVLYFFWFSPDVLVRWFLSACCFILPPTSIPLTSTTAAATPETTRHCRLWLWLLKWRCPFSYIMVSAFLAEQNKILLLHKCSVLQFESFSSHSKISHACSWSLIFMKWACKNDPITRIPGVMLTSPSVTASLCTFTLPLAASLNSSVFCQLAFLVYWYLYLSFNWSEPDPRVKIWCSSSPV